MKVVKLSNIKATLESGCRPKGGIIDGKGDVPSLGAEHLNNQGGFEFGKLKKIPHNFFSSMSKGVLKRNDILVVKDGATTGKASFVSNDFPYKEAAINEHLFLLRYDDREICAKYIFWHLFSPKGQSQILKDFRGATVGGISRGFLEKIEIPLPPLEEQKRIADILDKADAIRQKRKQAIKLADDFIKSVFLDMFGDPITNSKKWKTIPLGQLCRIRRGASPRPISKYLGGNVPWIKIGDGAKNDDIYIEETKDMIIREGVNKSVYLEPGSLIFANCGVSLGFARIIKIAGCIHDGWLAFDDFDSNINEIYLLKTLNSITNYFRQIAPDGTQPNLNTTIMKDFKIPLPHKNLQDSFCNIVLKVQENIKVLKKALEESNIFFNSISQYVFKGELL